MTNWPNFNQAIANLANDAKAWPFVEARSLAKRLEAQKRVVAFKIDLVLLQ